MNIKFKDGKPRMANLGRRLVPKNGEKIVHPDGTVMFLLNAVSEKAAVDAMILASRFNQSDEDRRYLTYLYTEHILDLDEPDEKMFFMLLDDFNQWWRHLSEKLGTDE